MEGSWVLGVAGWIIADGAYEDFEVGQQRDFAVELLPRSITLEKVTARRLAMPVDREIHDFVGELVFAGGGAYVMDVGCFVVAGGLEYLPASSGVGDVLTGRGPLGLDPCCVYIEPGFLDFAPARVYSWRIHRIEMETTPLIETESRTWIRDPSNTSYVTVSRTNAWEDDGGGANYLLHCSLLSGPNA
jgi:hypothetical protein